MAYSFTIAPLVGGPIGGINLGFGSLVFGVKGYAQVDGNPLDDALSARADASFYLNGDLLDAAHAGFNGTLYDQFPKQSFSLAGVMGTVYQVVIEAGAGVYGNNLDGVRDATAVVDPIITLRPDLQDQYTILFSPGLADDSSTDAPEPTPLALMGSMFLGASVLRLCKSRRQGRRFRVLRNSVNC